MVEENGDTIIVREQEAQIVVKDGDKTFKYARDENGKLRIVATEGLKEENNPNLLDRLLNAQPSNCVHCLQAELRETMLLLYIMEFLDTEEDLFDF